MKHTYFLHATLIALALATSTLAAQTPSSQQHAHADHATASDTARAFTLGKLSAVALLDGAFQFPNDGKTIGVGHSPDEIGAVLAHAGASPSQLSLSIQPLLVKAGKRVLLFDTGIGAGMGETPGKLLASLSAAGVDPASVTDIFISHIHGDHVGGILTAAGAPAFANATVHLSAPEWAFLKSMDEKTAQGNLIAKHAALVAAISRKVDAFAPGGDIIPGLVQAVEIKGHTPGHSGYLISSGADSLLYIGDSMHHYIISVQKPDWTIAFDADAPTAQRSRSEVIARAAASGQRIYAVHFPFPGIGKFVKDGDGYAWKAE